MTSDMEDFLKSCVQKYCELAGISEGCVVHADTPFIERNGNGQFGKNTQKFGMDKS